MKKNSKVIPMFIALVLALSCIALPALAVYEPKDEERNLESTFIFQSVDDSGINTTGIPVSTRQQSGLIANIRTYASQWHLAGYNDKIYANGSRLDSCKFIKYLTDSWAKAASYAWSKSNTCTWNFSGQAQFGEKVKATLGLSTSRTTSYSVAINIPADSTRNSKLAFGNDYFYQSFFVNRDVIDTGGQVTETKYSYDTGWTYTPTEDSYLYVVYQ